MDCQYSRTRYRGESGYKPSLTSLLLKAVGTTSNKLSTDTQPTQAQTWDVTQVIMSSKLREQLHDDSKRSIRVTKGQAF